MVPKFIIIYYIIINIYMDIDTVIKVQEIAMKYDNNLLQYKITQKIH